MRKQTAFTLIELLVVVAIIAVLVAILLPALSSARDKARLTVCMSNVRQLEVGFMAYAEDYGNYLPTIVARSYTSLPPVTASLALLYPRYIASPGAFKCAGSLPDDLETVTLSDNTSFSASYVYQDSGVAAARDIQRPGIKLWKEYNDRIWYNEKGVPLLCCRTSPVYFPRPGVVTRMNHGGPGIVFGRSSMILLTLDNGLFKLQNYVARDDCPPYQVLTANDSIYYLYFVTQWRGWNYAGDNGRGGVGREWQ